MAVLIRRREFFMLYPALRAALRVPIRLSLSSVNEKLSNFNNFSSSLDRAIPSDVRSAGLGMTPGAR